MKLKIIIFLAIVCSFILLGSKYSFSQNEIELQTIYSISVEISQTDHAELKDIAALNGTVSAFPSIDTGYYAKVFSDDGKELFNANLGVSFKINYETGIMFLNKTTIHLRVPYYSNAKSISFYHKEKSILDVDLTKQFCNNNSICDLGESTYNCPDDCKEKVEGTPTYFYILIVSAIILVILIFNYIRMKRKSSSFDSLKRKWS